MDYIIDEEEFLEKNREARSTRRATKKAKARKDYKRCCDLFHSLHYMTPEERLERWGYINPCDWQRFLAEEHSARIAWNRIEGLENLERPRRRYSIYKDYEDRPVKVVTVTHLVIVEEKWY